MKLPVLFVLTAYVLSVFLFVGCASRETISIDEEVPVWELSDTAYTQYMDNTLRGDMFGEYSNEYYQQPPYYTGSIPFTYTGHVIRNGSRSMELEAEFEDFTNYFIYESYTLVGAQTYDPDDSLIAELRLDYDPDDFALNPVQSRTGKEYHYMDGNLVFTCTSEFNSQGEKISEKDVQGEKITDCYFVLPSNY